MDGETGGGGIATTAAASSHLGKVAYLLGRPPIEEYFEFTRNRVLDPNRTDRKTLLEEWQRVEAHLADLKKNGARCAESAKLSDLSPELAPLADEHLRDPYLRRTLGVLPIRWALVDIDDLIAHQRRVNLDYVETLKDRFPQKATPEEVFNFAAGRSAAIPPVQVTRMTDSLFSFSSPSTDLRSLELAVLEPNRISGHQGFGNATHALAVVVGYSCNCIMALHIGGRLLLVNGTHRASALYALGYKQIPCLIQQVRQDSDFDAIDASGVRQHLGLYNGTCPPLLADFFNPELCAVYDVARVMHLLEVQVRAQKSRVVLPTSPA
jgi:hypothetical protein